jgi:hypothetical protein
MECEWLFLEVRDFTGDELYGDMQICSYAVLKLPQLCSSAARGCMCIGTDFAEWGRVLRLEC